ncbi:helix-turn-helix domain-containing protein [Novosphingobium resinovorum]|uniref:helix-turn-helix domain-containing protein n=1 Tax=Novosphingobium resinovorum TaxID=158500 RepID=UPI0009F30C67|nr:helix-turn-helix domain-containing protein [Novosphingobium resinovorum]
MQTPIAVTIPEAVRLSGISRTAIYEALARGDISARKAGRRTLIGYDELQTFLTSLPQYRSGRG